LICYWLTGNIVALGLFFGIELVEQSSRRGHMFDYAGEAYANWDGQWYKKIAAQGYDYDPGSPSSVAFFPAYPLLGGGLARIAGIRPEVALLVVSNLFLICLLCLTAKYVSRRFPGPPRRLADRVLLAMALVPTSFFFRMAYSESLFLTLTVLVLYAIHRGWPLPIIAVIVGLATAARPVGVGLIPALILHIWHKSPGARVFAVRTTCLVPVACWGIAAYMAYLYAEFGDPLAFARTQSNWRLRPPTTLGQRMLALVILEPIWSLYDPSGPAYWGKLAGASDPLFSLRAADPIYFLGAVTLVAVGAAKRWLSGCEVVTAASLLLIPYTTIGYDQYMQSMGRYSSAAFPVYIVLGHLLCRAPEPVVACLAGLSGFLLGAYTALFASWHIFI